MDSDGSGVGHHRREHRPVPPLPDVPEFLRARGVVIVGGACLDDEVTAAAALAPLRALEPEMDPFALVPPAALSQIHMDPEHPVPGQGDGTLLKELPPAAVDALVDVAGPGSGSPLLKVELRHVAGALERSRTGALCAAGGDYLAYGVGMAMDPETTEAVDARLARVRAAVDHYRSSQQLPGFSERPVDPACFFTPEVYARLRRIKARLDPDDRFRANHPIWPA